MIFSFNLTVSRVLPFVLLPILRERERVFGCSTLLCFFLIKTVIDGFADLDFGFRVTSQATQLGICSLMLMDASSTTVSLDQWKGIFPGPS